MRRPWAGIGRRRLLALSALFVILAAVGSLAAWWNNRLECGCPKSKFDRATYLDRKLRYFHQVLYWSGFYEDYVLSYVFEGQKTGFYVDVGANDPNRFNNTRYFYERGWSGINIEPNPDEFAKLVKFRPRDKNYNVGIASAEGTLTFFKAAGRADPLSTFDQADAERLARDQHVTFTTLQVPVTTLDSLFAKSPPPAISFLSIDVEGFEQQVLESVDLKRYRPAVLCIEATEPTTEKPSYLGWEHVPVAAGYLFAMSDGLNRYYVHRDRADLLPRFIYIDMCVRQSKYGRHWKLDGFTRWD